MHKNTLRTQDILAIKKPMPKRWHFSNTYQWAFLKIFGSSPKSILSIFHIIIKIISFISNNRIFPNICKYIT